MFNNESSFIQYIFLRLVLLYIFFCLCLLPNAYFQREPGLKQKKELKMDILQSFRKMSFIVSK